MQAKLTNYKGEEMDFECLGCARERGKVDAGNILKSEYFDVHQDFENPIPGFVIISSRRHIKRIDEFTEERIDFINFLTKIRKALKECLKIDIVYLIQEEDTRHHFHIWMFPRYSWMDEKFGKKVYSIQAILEYARKNLRTPENLKKVSDSIEMLKAFFIK